MTPFIRSNKVQQFFSSINNNWMFLTRKNHFIIAIISNTFNWQFNFSGVCAVPQPCTKWWLRRPYWGDHRQTNTAAALSYILGEGYYLVGQHLVHDRKRYWPSDIRGGKFVILDVLRDQPKGRLLKVTPQIPTMTMLYRRNQKRVISSFISYLIDVYRVFNHLSVYSDFLSLSPLRLSVFGQLITGYKLLE